MLTNLFDITGFFVSILINLLLIALICYYFKRKIDNLEISQSEQAKTLYALLSQQNNDVSRDNDSKNIIMNDIMNGLDLSQMVESSHNDHEHINNTNDDESESESESESDEEDDSVKVIEPVEINEPLEPIEHIEPSYVEEEEVVPHEYDEQNNSVEDNELPENDDNTIKSLHINEIPETNINNDEEKVVENYEKLTVKELRNMLAEKGVQAKSSMNKGDIINILKGTSEINFEDNTQDV